MRQRKRFADGKVRVPYKHFLGYDRGKDGNLVINSEQAKVVKLIYKLFLTGLSYATIAKELMKLGIKSSAGNGVGAEYSYQRKDEGGCLAAKELHGRFPNQEG